MHYRYEPWLLDIVRGDSEFLRKMGIKPCVSDDPCPRPLPEEFICLCEMTHVRAKELLTKADHKWLKAMVVGWEREPAFQFSLDFCEHP